MQKMSLKLVLAILAFLIVLLGIRVFSDSFIQKEQKDIYQNKKKDSKIIVSTSFYPLYFFSKEITGSQAEVINLSKSGGEAHDFEPSTKDIKTIENSQLLIVNGAFFESWMDKFSDEITDTGTKILKVSEDMANLKFEEENREKIDPHTWLDPVLAKAQVQKITEKLKEVDPINANVYEKNGQELAKEMDQLDLDFKEGLTNCQKNEVITSHAAFAYLAKRYGFKQIAIQGLNPDEDPSPAKLASVVKLAKENKIDYIFFETLVSPKISETIAKEIGAKTLIFNPIEGLSDGDEKSGKDYFSIQRENLNNLRLALNCQ